MASTGELGDVFRSIGVNPAISASGPTTAYGARNFDLKSIRP